MANLLLSKVKVILNGSATIIVWVHTSVKHDDKLEPYEGDK